MLAPGIRLIFTLHSSIAQSPTHLKWCSHQYWVGNCGVDTVDELNGVSRNNGPQRMNKSAALNGHWQMVIIIVRVVIVNGDEQTVQICHKDRTEPASQGVHFTYHRDELFNGIGIGTPATYGHSMSYLWDNFMYFTSVVYVDAASGGQKDKENNATWKSGCSEELSRCRGTSGGSEAEILGSALF